MKRRKIAIVFGTRPEAIKMAPVIQELKKNQEAFATNVIVTAQHREMLDQVLKVFDIEPDFDLNIMKKNQSLSDITADTLRGLEEIYIQENYDMVLVHGDTTTSFSAALAAYYRQIPIGHVEAGLRTYDKNLPYPEEANRQMIDSLADYCFVPTVKSKENLLREGKTEENIVVTGNTVIDSIHYTKKLKINHKVLALMESNQEKKWILLTMHRRENYGKPMNEVFEAVIKLINKYEELEVLVPVHLSPIVQTTTQEVLGNHDRIHLIDPLEVDIFHQVINKSYLVLTDSGGLQEEAPALDVPVLVLRDKTERPEGAEVGTLKVIGTNKNRVVRETTDLITNKHVYDKMVKAVNPYGDGLASKRIMSKIMKRFDESE